MAVETVKIVEGTQPLVAPLPFSEAEFQRRLDGLRATMREKGLDAFISFTPENLYYVTGHDTPGYYFYQAMVVTLDHKPVNVLRRIETTNTLGRSWSRQVVGYEDREDPVAKTIGLLHELGVAGKKVGAESESWFVTPKRYAQLQAGVEAAGGSLVDASGSVEALRVIKFPEELAYIRQGCRAVERAMTAAINASREGTNENEVAAACVAELIRAGGEYAGLPPFITSGPRTSLCHSTWAGRVFEKGDVIEFELPGVINRYCGSLFRCGTVGPASDEIKANAAMVTEALFAVEAKAKAGRSSHEVHGASKAVFEKHGKGHLLGHRTGYSIGINYPPDWGEGQIMSIWDGDMRPLRAGMTFHLVPGIMILGQYAITISDSILITDDGCEVLTNFPHELFVC